MTRNLYKARMKDAGEWVVGGVYEHCPPLQCVSSGNPESTEMCIVRTGFADWNMPRPAEIIKVDAETLCQCTGYKDLDGKPVFEHDLCIDVMGNVIVVIWDCYQFSAKILKSSSYGETARFPLGHLVCTDKKDTLKVSVAGSTFDDLEITIVTEGVKR